MSRRARPRSRGGERGDPAGLRRRLAQVARLVAGFADRLGCGLLCRGRARGLLDPIGQRRFRGCGAPCGLDGCLGLGQGAERATDEGQAQVVGLLPVDEDPRPGLGLDRKSLVPRLPAAASQPLERTVVVGLLRRHSLRLAEGRDARGPDDAQSDRMIKQSAAACLDPGGHGGDPLRRRRHVPRLGAARRSRLGRRHVQRLGPGARSAGSRGRRDLVRSTSPAPPMATSTRSRSEPPRATVADRPSCPAADELGRQRDRVRARRLRLGRRRVPDARLERPRDLRAPRGHVPPGHARPARHARRRPRSPRVPPQAGRGCHPADAAVRVRGRTVVGLQPGLPVRGGTRATAARTTSRRSSRRPTRPASRCSSTSSTTTSARRTSTCGSSTAGPRTARAASTSTRTIARRRRGARPGPTTAGRRSARSSATTPSSGSTSSGSTGLRWDATSYISSITGGGFRARDRIRDGWQLHGGRQRRDGRAISRAG